ncbi:MAG TPA: hypothetical protein PLX23_07415 [Candidatus Hydrogenedens sp.]|nr:hypothetical protein [Candidatus Hydrogenedens sp.]
MSAYLLLIYDCLLLYIFVLVMAKLAQIDFLDSPYNDTTGVSFVCGGIIFEAYAIRPYFQDF